VANISKGTGQHGASQQGAGQPGSSQHGATSPVTPAVPLTNELRSLDPAIASLRSKISGLGAALFDLEQTPALPLASGSSYSGSTAKTAKAMQAALGELWLGYPKLVAVMEDVETARGNDDSLRSHERDELRALLVNAHAELAGKTLEEEHDRLTGLLGTARKHLETIDFGFAACATTLGELDALARSAMMSAEQTGERVNEVARLTKQLAEQRLAAAADPLGWQGADASGIATQLRALATELGVVLQTQERLDEYIVEGAKRLDGLRLLIANGISAAAKARSRMADTGALPAPLRVSVLDGVDGLRNRLGAVRTALDGEPRRARQLWTLWDRDMSSIEATANSVLQRNAHPIAERDGLRGRLDGFEAKAAAAGVVELSSLVELHREAMALLTTPPVSLGACEAAVTSYGQAVSVVIAKRSTIGAPSPLPTATQTPATLAGTKVNS
jgi:hypothetical protein